MRIRQRDLSDCGASCLAAICAYYGTFYSVADIRRQSGSGKEGVSVLGLVRAAEHIGFRAKGAKASIDDLREAPLPAIAHMIIQNSYHFVVVCKINRNKVTIMDPADGTFKKLDPEEFANQFTGVVILLIPGDQFRGDDKSIKPGKRLWLLARPHRMIILQSLAGAVAVSLLGLSMSVFVQKIVDNVFPDENLRLLHTLGLIMLALLIFQVIIGMIRTILALQTGQRIDTRLILGYFRTLLQLPQSFFDSMRVGEVISRMNDAVKIRSFINEVSVNLVVNVFILLFSFMMMFFYYWKLALLQALIIPIYAALYFVGDRINRNWQKKVMVKNALLDAELVESLQAIGTIKKLGLEDHTQEKTASKLTDLLRTVYRESVFQLYLITTAECISRFFTIIILWTGSYFVIARELTPGELLSFYSLMGFFTAPAMQLLNANKNIREALIAAERLFEVMLLSSEIKEDHTLKDATEVSGDISFKQVCFAFGHEGDVFSNMDATIKNGSFTAITGESGCGKSTFALLLLQIYRIQKGSITISNMDINFFSLASLRKTIGIVPQQTELFSGTILENITIGDNAPDLQRALDIAERLGIDHFIEKLPGGFHTLALQQGSNFSGGQRQRISIARTIYRNPSILILDEATAGLDTLSETRVLDTLQWFNKQGKTVIIIAHRLSTLIRCDHILTIDQGRIVQSGNHAELIAAEGKYRSLFAQHLPNS